MVSDGRQSMLDAEGTRHQVYRASGRAGCVRSCARGVQTTHRRVVYSLRAGCNYGSLSTTEDTEDRRLKPERKRTWPLCPPCSPWWRVLILQRSLRGSRVRQRARWVLLEIEDASGDALALVRREGCRRVRDIERREQAAEGSRRDGLRDPLLALALLFAFHALLAFGERPSHVDLVHANPVAVQKRRGVFRQRHQAALGHRIGAELRLADVGEDRSDVDDRPAAARPHGRNRLLQQYERRPQIHGHDRVPARNGDVLEVAASGVGGVVHENVQAAKALHRKANQRAADLLVREIAVEVLRIAPNRLDAADRLDAVGAVASVHHDVRPKAGEMLCDAAADPGSRSGHDRDLVGEVAHGTSTDLMTRPSCIAANASRHPSSGDVNPTIASGSVRRRSSRWITRSQIGKLWLKAPCSRIFF